MLPTNTIICGDNVSTMAEWPDDCIDLTVTSPPYDGLRPYDGYVWDFGAVARQLVRITKPGGVIVWIVSDQTIDGSESCSSFRQALAFVDLGMRLHDTMIWQKPEPSFPDPRRYGAVHEYMFVFSRGAPATFDPILKRNSTAGKPLGGTYRRDYDGVSVLSKTADPDKKRNEYGKIANVWQHNNGDDSEHPAVFPESLARDHILSWSKPGDVVLDPHNGSGTTTKMAKAMGRLWLGIDCCEAYCKMAQARVQQGVFNWQA